MSPRARRFTARQIERVLSRYGFVFVSQKGSHRKWRHPLQRRQVIVPEHGNRPLPTGTLRSIVEGADLPEHEWRA